jgi:hypothetical protein
VESVYSAVRTESLYETGTVFKGLKSHEVTDDVTEWHLKQLTNLPVNEHKHNGPQADMGAHNLKLGHI